MKNRMQKIASQLFLATSIFSFATGIVSARECHSVYGGGEVCENGDLSIDKKVFSPFAKAYVDNIDSKDYVFAPNEEVRFSLRIRNVSDVRVDSARINDDFDRLDDYMVYVSSDKGDYRAEVTDNKVKFDFGGLDPDEEATVYFVSRFKLADQLPVGTTCITNSASAYSHDDATSDSDFSNFCVNNSKGKIITGEQTPATGLDLGTILILEALVFIIIGSMAWIKSRSMTKK